MTLENLFNAWPLMLIALLLVVGLLLFLAAGVDAGTRFRLEWMGYFFWAVPLALIAGVIIQGRTLGVEVLGGWRPDIEDYATSSAGSRVVTLACLAVAGERIVRFILRQEYRGAQGAPLLYAFLIYILCVNGVSAALGTVHVFSHQYLYAPLFALAMFAYAQRSGDAIIPLVRNAMLAMLLASLLALAVKPSMVAEMNYAVGLIPKLGLRFYGFATHPNTLAPLCFVLMCCMFLQPFQRRWLRWLAWTVAWVCLLLTQSKTSVGLAAVLLSALWAQSEVVAARRQGGAIASSQRGLFIVAVSLGGIALVCALLLLLAMFNDVALAKLVRLVDKAQFVSLSGRTDIWRETLKAVAENPVFGYGPGLWDSQFRMKVGLFFTHAHNQYLQTLGAGGIVGLTALLAYLVVLLKSAWAVRGPTRGVSLALAAYLILRGLTEVPLSVSSAMQSEYLVQVFLLALCWSELRRQAAPGASAVEAVLRRQAAARYAPPPLLQPRSH